MVRLPHIAGVNALEAAALALGLLVSVSALVALCAKHSSRFSSKFGSNSSNSSSVVAPRSLSAKQFLTAISSKAIPFLYKKRTGEESGSKEPEEGFGDGGLWQRAILMGDKCQPPDFSGVIYYDCDGKQLPELPPKSPRATPLHGFSFPAAAKLGN